MLMNKKYLKYIEKYKITKLITNSSFWKIIKGFKKDH